VRQASSSHRWRVVVCLPESYFGMHPPAPPYLHHVDDVDIMQYFTDASKQGCVRYSQISGIVGVFGSPDCLLMIGTARKVDRTGDDLAVWSLRVHLVPIPGHWTIIDGKFVPVDSSTQAKYSPLPPDEHTAMPIVTTQANGKTWKALQGLGFLSLCGSITWTVTTWSVGVPGQINRLAITGAWIALGSVALMIFGRLGAWWFNG
jgi:hypothetical protein